MFRKAPKKIGLVYYADDPDQKTFRKVFPERSDRELRDQQWVTLGCNPERTAIMRIVDAAIGAATPLDGIV